MEQFDMIWCGVTFEWYHSMGKNSQTLMMTYLFCFILCSNHARVASSETSSLIGELVELWFMTAWIGEIMIRHVNTLQL